MPKCSIALRGLADSGDASDVIWPTYSDEPTVILAIVNYKILISAKLASLFKLYVGCVERLKHSAEVQMHNIYSLVICSDSCGISVVNFMTFLAIIRHRFELILNCGLGAFL